MNEQTNKCVQVKSLWGEPDLPGLQSAPHARSTLAQAGSIPTLCLPLLPARVCHQQQEGLPGTISWAVASSLGPLQEQHLQGSCHTLLLKMRLQLVLQVIMLLACDRHLMQDEVHLIHLKYMLCSTLHCIGSWPSLVAWHKTEEHVIKDS